MRLPAFARNANRVAGVGLKSATDAFGNMRKSTLKGVNAVGTGFDNLRSEASKGYSNFRTGVGMYTKDYKGYAIASVLVLVILSLIIYIGSKKKLLCAEDPDKAKCDVNMTWTTVIAGVCMALVCCVIISSIYSSITRGKAFSTVPPPPPML